jgi:hypothetical protein
MGRGGLMAGERILLTLWVGGMWTLGYVVAPVLFATLDERSLAGEVAGRLFTIMAYVGLVCGALLLLINSFTSKGVPRGNWRAGVLLIMLGLVATGQFLLSPRIALLRASGEAGSEQFARLHGMASVLFVATSLLGMVLVIAGSSRPATD